MIGKKKGKVYKSLTIMLALFVLVMGLASFAAAEQEWLPGYGDKNGTLGKDGQSWRVGWVNSSVFEGPTSNDFHTFLSASDPSAINRLLLPDESGTLLSTGGAAAGIPLADTKMLIGQSTGLSAAQSIGTGHSVTNAGAFTHIANTVSSADILNGTIAAIDMGANAIGTAAFNVNTVSVPIVDSASSGTATVTTGSTILGFYPFANIDAEVANIVAISGTTLTVTLKAAAADDSVVYKVIVLEP